MLNKLLKSIDSSLLKTIQRQEEKNKSNHNVVIIDLETTGLSFDAKIIEIALIVYDPIEKKILQSYNELLNPFEYINSFVQELTGIANKGKEKRKAFYEVSEKVKEMIEGRLLIGHKVEFDFNILKGHFEQLGQTINNKTLCTLDLVKKFYPDLDSYSLVSLSKNFGIELKSNHRAHDDAKATLGIYQHLYDHHLNCENRESSFKSSITLEKYLFSKIELTDNKGCFYRLFYPNQKNYFHQLIESKSELRVTNVYKYSHALLYLKEMTHYDKEVKKITDNEPVRLILDSKKNFYILFGYYLVGIGKAKDQDNDIAKLRLRLHKYHIDLIKPKISHVQFIKRFLLERKKKRVKKDYLILTKYKDVQFLLYHLNVKHFVKSYNFSNEMNL